MKRRTPISLRLSKITTNLAVQGTLLVNCMTRVLRIFHTLKITSICDSVTHWHCGSNLSQSVLTNMQNLFMLNSDTSIIMYSRSLKIDSCRCYWLGARKGMWPVKHLLHHSVLCGNIPCQAYSRRMYHFNAVNNNYLVILSVEELFKNVNVQQNSFLWQVVMWVCHFSLAE